MDFKFSMSIHYEGESKDFLDYYIFPTLLPAIESLINYAKVNRVLRCRYCTFVPMDYIVEYLFNNNSKFPERKDQPTELNNIPFVASWLQDQYACIIFYNTFNN